MYINGFDGDPYAEVQHILEVLERGNPVKGINIYSATIQIEQSKDKDVQIVLEELKYRGYTITFKKRYGNFTAVGIEKERKKDKKNEQEKKGTGGFELGD